MPDVPATPLTAPATPPPAAAAASPAAKAPDAAPAPAEAKPPEPAKDSAAERFAALARKERMVVEEKRALKAKEAEWAKERDELRKQLSALEPLAKARELAASDPFAVLKAFNLDYDKLTEAALNRKELSPEEVAREAARAEFEAQRKAQAEAAEKLKREETARIERERAQAMETFRGEVRDFIATNADTYELTALNKADNLVVQVVEQHFASTGKVLSTKEAADLVESHLEEQAVRLAATKKLSAKLKPVSAPAEAAPSAPAASSATLHNGLSASTPASAGPLTYEERRARALAKLEAMGRK